MRQKKLALSMRGGGAKCHAYLGLLKLLEEEDIKIDYIVGSSGGAVIGGCYAACGDIDLIVKYGHLITLKKMFDIHSISHFDIANSQKVQRYIQDVIGKIDIEDTKIKFWAQVTDFNTHKSELIGKGNLSEILTASLAFPFLTEPIKFNKTVYGDGDLSSGFETGFLKNKGADIVIGLKVSSQVNKHHSLLSLSITEPISILKKTILDFDQKFDPVDLLIKDMDNGVGSSLDFNKAYELMDEGYKVSRKYIKNIKSLLNY